jgi:hypothetical protein
MLHQSGPNHLTKNQVENQKMLKVKLELQLLDLIIPQHLLETE